MLARHGVFFLAFFLCHSTTLSRGRGHLWRSRLQPGKRGYRAEILQQIFHPPPRRDALEEFSNSKNSFLLGGNAQIFVENRGLHNLMDFLYTLIADQYSVFHKIDSSTNNLRGKERTLGLPKYESPLASIYMARGNEDLRDYLSELWELAERCQRELKKLLDAHKAVEAISPSETEVPSADQMKAEKLVRDSGLGISACERLSNHIKRTMEDLDVLRKREQREECTIFLDHQTLRQGFLRAIQDQRNSFLASAVPFHPRPLEDASRAVRDSLSEGTRSASESSEHQFAVQRSTSRSVRLTSSRASSAGHKGSKRKRNQENDESQGREKRLAHTCPASCTSTTDCSFKTQAEADTQCKTIDISFKLVPLWLIPQSWGLTMAFTC